MIKHDGQFKTRGKCRKHESFSFLSSNLLRLSSLIQQFEQTVLSLQIISKGKSLIQTQQTLLSYPIISLDISFIQQFEQIFLHPTISKDFSLSSSNLKRHFSSSNNLHQFIHMILKVALVQPLICAIKQNYLET